MTGVDRGRWRDGHRSTPSEPQPTGVPLAGKTTRAELAYGAREKIGQITDAPAASTIVPRSTSQIDDWDAMSLLGAMGLSTSLALGAGAPTHAVAKGSGSPSPASSSASPSTTPPAAPNTAPREDVQAVAKRWPSGTALGKVRGLSDGELVRELMEVRVAVAKLSAPGGGREDSASAYHALRAAQGELEYEARRRTDKVAGQQRGLDVLADLGPLSMSDEHVARGPDAVGARMLALRKLEHTISRQGLLGAERAMAALERPPSSGVGEGAHASSPPMHWLRGELKERREEADGFLERFELVGRSICRALLAESASRLEGELARYGLRRKTPKADGSLRGMGGVPGHREAEVADAVAHGRELRAAYDRARSTAGSQRRAAWERFEAVKREAVRRHPLLAGFLDGSTRLAQAAPTGMVPNALELGNTPPALLGAMLGWEINRKILDNRATAENVESGKLSIFGAPRVVELTKLEMRVADGMALDGVVNERVAHAAGQPWTQSALQAITLALGLALALPSAGLSAGVATAGSLALLASDLYLLGKEAEERDAVGSAANTDLTLKQSLLDQEPAAAPLLHQVLGGLGLVTGVHGVVEGAAQLRAVALARRGVADMRRLRRTLALFGADAMSVQVREAIDQLRLTAREAGLAEERIEVMIRAALRSGVPARGKALGMGLDHAARVTEESALVLATRLGVPRVVRTGEPGGRVGVHLSRQGAPQVEQVEVAADATVGDVLLHHVTVDAVAKYRGAWGNVRAAQDQLAEMLRRQPRITGAGANPHPVRSRGYELFEEVRKHDEAVRARLIELIEHLRADGAVAQKAAWALEDQIKVLEGELAYYRQALRELRETGDVEAARGVIEGIGDASRSAVSKGYEPPPQGYYYHRNAWKPDEYVISRNAGREDLPQLQVNREGRRFTLGIAEEARAPRVFSAKLEDAQVLDAMIADSTSWRTFRDALVDPDKVALPAAVVRRRSIRTVEKLRKADNAGKVGRVEVTDALLRRVLKDEFRDDILRAASKRASREEQITFLRRVTEDFNGSDKGSLFEALLGAQDRSLTRHAVMDQAALASGRPPVHISRDRVVDLLGTDGTLIEVKAVKTAMGREQLEQLQDYLAVVSRGGKVAGRNGAASAKRIVYAFMEPEGVAANRTFIAEALDGGATVRVYNRSGSSRDFGADSAVDAVVQFAQGSRR